ncbi:hypothetical protein SUDANB6_05785 [Streptomyces sp. enrichment culture]|uniref:hypothetical protein n=1 Tax=Streptomyces sp. enrichment culture TaxID=1795815 RepID=UPI003F543F83
MPHPVDVAGAETDGSRAEFASCRREKKPLSLLDAPVRLGVADDELLRALVPAAGRANRPKGSGLPKAVVTVDGRTQPIDTRSFLPPPEARSLDEYTARVGERM